MNALASQTGLSFNQISSAVTGSVGNALSAAVIGGKNSAEAFVTYLTASLGSSAVGNTIGDFVKNINSSILQGLMRSGESLENMEKIGLLQE